MTVFVLMTVKEILHLQFFGELINRQKAFSMTARRFMGDQHISAMLHEVIVGGRENGRAVASRQSPSPHIAAADSTNESAR